ncbi:MAG: T9SS type A sorting domain-containing protein [Bacteroidetes bacterium]|nr:T9SS type A sorting domain-containing protein [Bacteroidota bacterium]
MFRSIFKKALLACILLEVFSNSLKANPGDTTWVTIYNLRKIMAYGSYDTTAILPTGIRYRKMRLHYILGRYSCPSSEQYCGSWDYTTQIYAKPPGKDTVEIARVITPYATDWMATNRKHDYVIEVSDYAKSLEGPTGFKFFYSGYSWGFTITLKLELIEGVPPMDALSAGNIYDGYFAYGKTIDPIENHLTPKTFSYTTPVTKAFIKNSVSGHGSDDNNCSEFCSKYYDLKINNVNVSQKQLWRNTCGLNNIYPQTGTWVYDRANWCPGAVVWPIYHDLSSITTANTTFSVDIDMEPYTAPTQTNASAGYQFTSQMINYSAPNHSLDISIEDIISPSKNENNYRSNPSCRNPVIKIKNVGTNSVTSVVFNYGLIGNTALSYTWTGNLNFLDETLVTFPPSLTIYTNNIVSTFQASVVSVNGVTDQNSFNNTYVSQTSPVSVYPASFVLKINTNNATNPLTNFNETSYVLYDQNGAVVIARDSLQNVTYYTDTIHNLTPGCYKLVIDDAGCDGYKFWVNTAPGNGNIRFENLGIGNVFYNPNGDIGCQLIKYFVVANTTGITENIARQNEIGIYPNPANTMAYLQLDLVKDQAINYKITEVTGKLMQQKSLNKISEGYEKIDMSGLENGVYFISVELQNNLIITKKLIVQH